MSWWLGGSVPGVLGGVSAGGEDGRMGCISAAAGGKLLTNLSA